MTGLRIQAASAARFLVTHHAGTDLSRIPPVSGTVSLDPRASVLVSFLPEDLKTCPVYVVDVSLIRRTIVPRSGIRFSGSASSVVVALVNTVALQGRMVSYLVNALALNTPSSSGGGLDLLRSQASVSASALEEEIVKYCLGSDFVYPSTDGLVSMFTSLRGLDMDEGSLAAGWFEKDKGRIGKYAELLCGLLASTSEESDLPGGCDIKATRVRRSPDSGLPALCEAISLALLDFDELAGGPLGESRLFRKCQSLLIVAIEDYEGSRYLLGATLVPLFSDESVFKVASADWEEVRSLLRSDGPSALSSADGLGTFLMVRPKGGQSRYMAWDADKPRGYYLRPSFANSLVAGIHLLPVSTSQA